MAKAPPGSPLAKARMAAHAAFDPLWQSRCMSRNEAYRWLADKLRLPRYKCHMVQFDEAVCARVVELSMQRRSKMDRDYLSSETNYGAADHWQQDDDDTGTYGGRLTTADAVEKFMLAGNATITLVSEATARRFTYKVAAPEDFKADRPIWFVKVLGGPDNTADFWYIGQLRVDRANRLFYEHGKKARVAATADSVTAFTWFSRHLCGRGELPKGLQVWHEGRCGRCGRKLTVPESVESGFGPECIQHV